MTADTPPGGVGGAAGVSGVSGRGGEWDLVQAAQGGDREAFGRLYARYADQVRGVARSRTGNPVLAQDLTQDTFERAWRGIGSVTYQGRDLGAWLTTITRNLVTDHWKSARQRVEVPVAEVRDAATGRDDPERAVIRAETSARVRRALAGLGADQRRCVELRHLQELSVADTAAVTGHTEAAVKGLTHRGLVGLRAALADERTGGPGPPGPPGSAVAGPGVGDPLAGARAAVAAVRRHCDAAVDRAGGDVDDAERAARWHADDRTAARAREHDRGVAAEHEGAA